MSLDRQRIHYLGNMEFIHDHSGKKETNLYFSILAQVINEWIILIQLIKIYLLGF